MSKYKEILRLLSTTGLSGRQIASQLHVGRDSVAAVRQASSSLKLQWEEVKDKSEDEIHQTLFPRKKQESIQVKPDFNEMLKDYDRIPGMTKKVLWEDYAKEVQATGGIPYQYSQFCELFAREATVNNATMHKQHKPGERIEVDWAGTKVPITDPDTGYGSSRLASVSSTRCCPLFISITKTFIKPPPLLSNFCADETKARTNAG